MSDLASCGSQMFTDKGLLKECVTPFLFLNSVSDVDINVKGSSTKRQRNLMLWSFSALLLYHSWGTPNHWDQISPITSLKTSASVSSLVCRLWGLFLKCSSLCIIHRLKSIEPWDFKAKGKVKGQIVQPLYFIELGHWSL